MPADIRERLQESLGQTFTIERELPRGGMSRVYVALENALGRHVVIKVLAPELTASLSAERFKREISLAARLQHPNIVPLLSAGTAGASLYYTMPLVDGESLRERMAHGRMPVDDAARILEDVAAALAYAHREGVVHRDIKPENVMFFHDRAVVLDFGIGKAVNAARRGAESGEAQITQAGMSLGTPTYIAPEQARGDPELDHRADLYALGVVAYELFTGHPPFRGRDARVIMQAHATQPPEPIEVRRPDLPVPVRSIVMQCLAKSPSARPTTGDAIVSALACVTRPSGSTATVSPHGRIPSWVPWAIAALSTAVALTLALLLARKR
jgi:serine/threonine protein kinase